MPDSANLELSIEGTILHSVLKALDIKCPVCHLSVLDDPVVYSCCITLAHDSCTNENQKHNLECPKCAKYYDTITGKFAIWTKCFNKARSSNRTDQTTLIKTVIQDLWQQQQTLALSDFDRYLFRALEDNHYPLSYFTHDTPHIGLVPDITYGVLNVTSLNTLQLGYIYNEESAHNLRPIVLIAFNSAYSVLKHRILNFVKWLGSQYGSEVLVKDTSQGKKISSKGLANQSSLLSLCIPGLGRNYVLISYQTDNIRKILDIVAVPIYWQYQWLTNVSQPVNMLLTHQPLLMKTLPDQYYIPYSRSEVKARSDFVPAEQYVRKLYPDWTVIMEICVHPTTHKGARAKAVCSDLAHQPERTVRYELHEIESEHANRVYVTDGHQIYPYEGQIIGQAIKNFVDKLIEE